MNARFRRSQGRWVSIQKEKQRLFFDLYPVRRFAAYVLPPFLQNFPPLFPKSFPIINQKTPKIKKAKTRWKSQKCFEEHWKSNPNPKKGHRLGCWGWETWLLTCLGLPRASKKIFFLIFFSDFGNLVRRNDQNIDFLEYFDDKSDVYGTNRAEIVHAVIFWEDL